MMDREQIRLEHKERVTQAGALAINHAALLVGESVREFVAELTEKNALNRADVLGRIKQFTKVLPNHPALTKPEQNLLLAVEKLHHINSSASMRSGDFEGLLVILWNGVGECLDREQYANGEGYDGDGPLQSGEQHFHDEVVRPLIQSSVEMVREAEERFKQERKLQKVAV
jgi:hypothetical protein